MDHLGYCPVIDPKYVVLGMLDEYMGRPPRIENSTRVESFYPAEKEIADKFFEYLAKFLKNESVEADVARTLGPHGHHIFESKEVMEFINNIYAENFINSFYGPVHGISESMFAQLSERFFLNYEVEPVDCRFSYLLGAYIRYGRNNTFEFANATQKVDLIVNFLERLGAKWLSKSWSIGGVPRCTIIQFGPDDVLARLFGIKETDLDWNDVRKQTGLYGE